MTYRWMFLYPRYADRAKGKAMRDFAEWTLSQQAQNYGAQLGYLPLSPDVTALVRRACCFLQWGNSRWSRFKLLKLRALPADGVRGYRFLKG